MRGQVAGVRALLGLLAVAAAGGCYSKSIDGTSLVVTVSFQGPVDQLSFRGATADGGELFPLVTAPQTAGAALVSPQSARILLSGSLPQQTAQVAVVGLQGGQPVAQGSNTFVVSPGQEVDVSVTLSGSDGGTDGGTDGGADGGACPGGAELEGQMCSKSGHWCWEFPLPTGNLMTSAWAASDCEVWAVGEGGVALHRVGSTWTVTDSGVDQNLNGVWGSGPNDVWAVGDCGVVLHWTAGGWNPVNPVQAQCLASTTLKVTLEGVWGTSPTNAWAVGYDSSNEGVIYYWDGGGAWQDTNVPGLPVLIGVWGSGPDDVWAVGASGRILHQNGAGWTNYPFVPSTPDFLTSVYGFSPGDAWAVGGFDAGVTTGSQGDIYSLVGQDWSVLAGVPESVMAAPFYSVWGTSSNDLILVGGDINTGGVGGVAAFDTQGTWHSEMGLALLRGVTGEPDGTVWAVGNGGTVYQGSLGNGLPTAAQLPVDYTQSRPTRLDAISQVGGDIWASGQYGVVLHYDAGWDLYASPSCSAPGCSSYELTSLWAADAGDVWGVGSGGLITHTNGSGKWDRTPQPYTPGVATWLGVSGRRTTATTLWLVTGSDGPELARMTDGLDAGVEVCPLLQPDGGAFDGGNLSLRAVATLPNNLEVVAVGDDGLVIIRSTNGGNPLGVGNCNVIQQLGVNLRAVWVDGLHASLSGGQIWAVGDGPSVWTGTSDTGLAPVPIAAGTLPTGFTGSFYSVSGADNTMWFGGSLGYGVSCAVDPSTGAACANWSALEPTGSYNTVRGSVTLSADEVRFVGDNTSLLHRLP
jgi:hypothetical protein